MTRDLQTKDDYLQRRLERLELRHRRARFVLAGAQAVYESLRETPGAGELQLRQALQRIEQAQEQLVDIQSTIEFLEDQEHVA
jgi:chromosome segregation ATPase